VSVILRLTFVWTFVTFWNSNNQDLILKKNYLSTSGNSDNNSVGMVLSFFSAYSELPAFLTQDGGLNSGFMIAHCTAAALGELYPLS